jgi:hypothetical protein
MNRKPIPLPPSLRALNAKAMKPVVAYGTANVVEVALLGMRLVNPLNNRQHWRVVWQRGKREKATTLARLAMLRPPRLPLDVEIVRVSRGRLDDDGATASAKHVRDAVAAWAGVDDGDVERIRFVVSQSKGAAGVRIIVRRRVGA